MMTLVQIGEPGNIKGLLKCIRKEASHCDVIFHCVDGTLESHRFILGAQSTYLKHILLQKSLDDNISIYLPDIKKHHLSIVMRFLYTGKLIIDSKDISAIKELLEDILFIDAKVMLPDINNESQMSEEMNQEIPLNQTHPDFYQSSSNVPSSFQIFKEEKNDEDSLVEDSTASNVKTFWPPMPSDDILMLPPVIPLPPQPGMVISKGNWVFPTNLKMPVKQNLGTVRKYTYKPYTLTGMVKPSTIESMTEAPGYYQCDICGLAYDRKTSLASHKARYHNQNLKAVCPECSKPLSSKGAIAKHLLSHRPQSHWPFACPLCYKAFQAKSDLPKHFMTAKHKDAVPEVGSTEWKELIELSSRSNNVFSYG